MQELVRLQDLDPNPYRRLQHYPIRRQKVEALKESLHTTGIWPRLMGRPVGKRYQIPFGHHLLAALLELYPPSYKIPLEIRQFTDSQMLQLMSRENMDEWGTDALAQLETVAAVIDGYDNGDIELEEPGKAHFRTARNKRYSAQTVGKFLGWVPPSGHVNSRIYWIIDALKLIDEGHLREDHLDGLNEAQAKELIGEITRRKTAREREAKLAEEEAAVAKCAVEKARSEVERDAAQKRERFAASQAEEFRKQSKKETSWIAGNIGQQLRKGEIASRQVRQKVNEILPSLVVLPNSKQLPDIKNLARQLARDIDQIFAKEDLRRAKVAEIADYGEHLDVISRELLVSSLDRLAGRLAKLVGALNQPTKSGAVKSAGPKKLEQS